MDEGGNYGLGFISSESNLKSKSSCLIDVTVTEDFNLGQSASKTVDDEVLTTPKKLRRVESMLSSETVGYLIDRNSQLYSITFQSLMTNQSEITPRHRQILIDWIMEVSDKFQLKKQTYNLAVHYVDTYITRSPDFALDKYQLLGITSLLISCKIEEIYFPKISDFEDVTDGKCTSSEIF